MVFHVLAHSFILMATEISVLRHSCPGQDMKLNRSLPGNLSASFTNVTVTFKVKCNYKMDKNLKD